MRRAATAPLPAVNGYGSRNGNGAGNGRSAHADVVAGRCRCGMPATVRCEGGCDVPVCGEHLLNRASRLAWPGPYRSEREHTVYLRAFWADAAARCTWCREDAGRAALARLPPVPPLPEGVVERLGVLLRHPHDHPTDAWPATVKAAGGPAAVLRLLAPALRQRKPAQEFPGRRRDEVLVGVTVTPVGAQQAHDVIDGAGVAWTVRLLGPGVVRKRRAWTWERTTDARLESLLVGLVECAQTTLREREAAFAWLADDPVFAHVVASED